MPRTAKPIKLKTGRKPPDPQKVERARVELLATGGNVTEVARRVAVPRSTLSGWIRDGVFNPDEWEHERDQRRLEAIEHAWDGLITQVKAAQEVPHNVFCTKDGDLVVGPENPHAAAQIADMLGKMLERLAGVGVAVKPGGEGTTPAESGEVVYKVIFERREGRPGGA